MTTLGRIVARTRERVEQKRREVPLDRVLAVAPTPGAHRQFSASISRPGAYNVIAEFKRRSPSRGIIREDLHPVYVAQGYEIAGAAALSILTEEEFFAGSLDDLQQARQATLLPTLRKDFIIDPIQVYEARMVGAAAILLIVRALTDGQLTGLSTLARQVGLETLVEVHSEAELERAVALRPDMIGVNARDLDTLVMDPWLVAALLPKVPPDIVAVAESGLKTREDVERVASLGADAVLVGTAVAGAEDPGEALKALVGVPKTRRVSE